MKKKLFNKIILITFVITAGLFLFSAFGATRSALIVSGNYDSQFEMYDIGVVLNENGDAIAWRTYNRNKRDWEDTGEAKLFSSLKNIRYGVTYPETLSVSNSGQIDEYVRVTIYKYWLDKNGKKTLSLDSDLIHFDLVTGDNGWIEDENYTTKERTVLYYTKVLKGAESVRGGETTPAFSSAMTLDPNIKNYVKQTSQKVDEETGYTVITTEYIYDGCTFCIDVQVDAVQTHNAEDAALSAWGRTIVVADDGTLSLGKE
ncbi:MAG: hypothetical protein IJF87_10705 [Erysipelotrichaceae bacterium]|nr:hypothetical protein [Erysipelotrichaceae bacterium]